MSRTLASSQTYWIRICIVTGSQVVLRVFKFEKHCAVGLLSKSHSGVEPTASTTLQRQGCAYRALLGQPAEVREGPCELELQGGVDPGRGRAALRCLALALPSGSSSFQADCGVGVFLFHFPSH